MSVVILDQLHVCCYTGLTTCLLLYWTNYMFVVILD